MAVLWQSRRAVALGLVGLALLALVALRHVTTYPTALATVSDASSVVGTRVSSMAHPVKADGEAVGFGGARWARSGAVARAGNEADGKYVSNNRVPADEFGPLRNAGGGYTGYAQPSLPADHIGSINPYTGRNGNSDLPHHGRTERGLPLIERRYHLPGPPAAWQAPGYKPVFAANQALRDLEPLKEFGLLSKKTYALQKQNIESAMYSPFGSIAREEPPSGRVPEGWTGPTTMCRDTTTKIAGLDNEGWTEMNTLKCCNYLCSKTQWTALRDGQLQWGLGTRNRYSSAVMTASTAKMADGSDKYLCRSCAWDREPNWKDYGLHGITKMEGHLCPFNTETGEASWTQFGDPCPEPEGVQSSTKSSDPEMADILAAHVGPLPGGVIEGGGDEAAA